MSSTTSISTYYSLPRTTDLRLYLPPLRPRVPSQTNISRSLLALPAEIRNTIYSLLLTSEHLPALRKLISSNHCSGYVLPPLPLCAALLSTCKQIYEEASPILYACNTFTASPTLLTSLPYLVDPGRPLCAKDACKKIRKWYIKVRIDCDPRWTEEMVTDAFTGAEELEVEAMEASWRASGRRVLMLFRGVRGVGKVKVTGSVDDEFAKWLVDSMTSPLGTEIAPFEEGEETRFAIVVPEVYDPWHHGNR